MNATIILAIVVGVLLAGGVVVATARRRDTDKAIGTLSRETKGRDRKAAISHIESDVDPRVAGKDVEQVAVQRWRDPGSGEIEKAGPSELAPYLPPDPDVLGVTRRQFLNRSIVATMGFSLSAFGVSVIAFLWPQSKGGFGSRLNLGSVDDIKASVAENDGFFYVPEGKAWITEYPAAALEKARAVYSPAELTGMEAGLIALFQKCPHLGCKVPECLTSQWFECGCHGSQYNRVGERRGGPAPRGMDRFGMSVDGGNFVVDTGTIIQGPPLGVDTTGQSQEGPSCLGASSH